MWGHSNNKKTTTAKDEENVSLKAAFDFIEMLKAVLKLKLDKSSDPAIAKIVKNIFRNKVRRINRVAQPTD
jgi:hypothetical protein